MKRDSYIPATNVTGTDKSNEEVWKLVNVLGGRRVDCDANPGGSHRAIGRSACMNEKGRIQTQALELRDLERLDKMPREDGG